MRSYLSSPWNNAISYLEMRFQEKLIATGSSFFWRHGDQSYLISNWHNFAGRSPVTGMTLSPHAALPDRLSALTYRVTSPAGPSGIFLVDSVPIEVPLYHEGRARWLQHPHFAERVDVAAINVTSHMTGLHYRHVNDLEENMASVTTFASQDVFILGFPLGIVTNVPIPVWKRGTIATDPSFDPDDLPKMFIDSATREGMSGSVVIARTWFSGPFETKSGEIRERSDGQIDQVIGVYSGRLHPDLVQAQLGIAWKRRCIEEIISAQHFSPLPAP